MTELALHIMDIMQNSILTNANRIDLHIYENSVEDLLLIEVTDNGYGIDKASLNMPNDTFFTSSPNRKVGMGLPLIRKAAEQCGGSFHIESEPDVGTRLVVTMKLSHVDRQPIGDIAGIISLIVASNPELDFIYKHSTEEGEFVFDTTQLKKMLEDISFTNPKVLRFIREMIQENLSGINMRQ